MLLLLDPLQGGPAGGAGAALVAGKLFDLILTEGGIEVGVDTHHHALHAEALGQAGDKAGIGQGRGVDGYLVGPELQDLAGILDAFDAAGDAEGDVDDFRHPAYPALVHYPFVARGGDVIEDQLIGALGGVAAGEVDNAAHHLVVAKLHALDHHAIFDVETGDNTL